MFKKLFHRKKRDGAPAPQAGEQHNNIQNSNANVQV